MVGGNQSGSADESQDEHEDTDRVQRGPSHGFKQDVVDGTVEDTGMPRRCGCDDEPAHRQRNR